MSTLVICTYLMGNPKLFPFFINAIKAVALSMTPNKDSTVFTLSITRENLKILTIPVYFMLNIANLKHLEKNYWIAQRE